jgi:type IV secretion system protein VirB9
MKLILFLFVIFGLGACATKTKVAHINYDNFQKAVKVREPDRPVKIVERPKPLPLPGQLKPLVLHSKHKKKGKKKPINKAMMTKRLAEAKRAALYRPQKQGFINAIQVYPFTKGALYQLYSAVNQVSDIALEPGEKLVSVSAGDTVRWKVGDTTSGQGALQQVHVLVKPIASDLTTNLVINTDKRTYHLELKSHKSAYMSSISWDYPQDSLNALKKQNALALSVDQNLISKAVKLSDLKFRYRITGTAPWKPMRVFDDGKKVYIQFPSGLSQGEAPPLFVMGSNGKPALVNYRVKGTYYIVDRLFAAAELRLGGKQQNKVKITRTDAIWREVGDDKPLFQ